MPKARAAPKFTAPPAKTAPATRVRIVQATPKQAYSLLVLTRAYFPYVKLKFDELQSRLNEQPRGEHLYLTAKKAGRTIGYSHLAFDSKKPSVRLLGLAVLEEFRRQGIGEKLLARSLKEARKRGARTLNLLVSENNSAALALYSCHHFEKRGRLHKPFQNERILVLSRSLAPA